MPNQNGSLEKNACENVTTQFTKNSCALFSQRLLIVKKITLTLYCFKDYNKDMNFGGQQSYL